MKYTKDIFFSIVIGFLGFKIFSIQEELKKTNNTLKKVKLNFAYENHDHSLSAVNIDYNEYETGYQGTLQYKIKELENNGHWLKFNNIEERLERLEYYH